jgi:hypothetical protein
MANPYQPPQANVSAVSSDVDNNSGGGKSIVIPEGIRGWSWGAFLLNWIWSIFNKTWIGLLAFIPYVGIIVAVYLGIRGRELAWRNKRWDSFEHFSRVQRSWSKWALIVLLIPAVLGIIAAILIPAYVKSRGMAVSH